jgi:hypothetical protein
MKTAAVTAIAGGGLVSAVAAAGRPVLAGLGVLLVLTGGAVLGGRQPKPDGQRGCTDRGGS